MKIHAMVLLAAVTGPTVVLTPLHAQESAIQTLIASWDAYSREQKVDFARTSLRRSDAEGKAAGLAAIGRLAMESPDFARREFDARTIAAHLNDENKDVVRNTLGTLVLIADDDAYVEEEIVSLARRGAGPMRPEEFVRYIRDKGISSGVAYNWLLTSTEGPISPLKFESVGALVTQSDGLPLPGTLLSEVMALVRSQEYFCWPTFVRELPRFGAAAVPYLDELRALRTEFLRQAQLPAEARAVKITTPPVYTLEQLDHAIEELSKVR